MTEDEIEKKKKEALIDYNLASNEVRKKRVKRIRNIFLILLVLLVIAILIRVFHGRVYYSVSFLNLNKSIEYNLYVNGEQECISFEDTEDNPIIPGLFYFRRYNGGIWYNESKLDEDVIFTGDEVNLKIEANECYTHTDKVRVSCDSANYKLVRKEVEPKFTRLFIRKDGKNSRVMYDGKFVTDISKYVQEKGYYYIEIYAEYDAIDTRLYMFPKKTDEVLE